MVLHAQDRVSKQLGGKNRLRACKTLLHRGMIVIFHHTTKQDKSTNDKIG